MGNLQFSCIRFQGRRIVMYEGTTNASIQKSKPRPTMNCKKRYGDFLVENNQLYLMKEKPKEPTEEIRIPLGDLVRIKEAQESIETGEIQLILEYWYLGNRKELAISRGTLQKKEFSKLMSYGVNASEGTIALILRFLDYQEKSDIQLTHTHQELGWAKVKDQLVFKHCGLIGTSTLNSTYTGKFDIKPKGTLEGWMNVVRLHIINQIALVFALVLGFSATLNSYLANFISIDTLVVHIYGDSSQGKTTSTIVAVSIFGRPTIKDNGLLLTWNSTTNSLIHELVGIHGIAIGLDEASMSGMKDYSRVIYQLAGSQEKGRMTSDIQLREKGSWSGTFISNAENSLQQQSNQNSGLLVRLPEYGNVQWTKSAEHADAIKRGFEENYGHAGPMFAEYIVKQDSEQLLQRLKAHETELLDVMTEKDNLSNRLASKYAVLLLTATLMNEVFPFQVDVAAIRDFIVEHDQNKVEDRDIGKRAIAALVPKIIEFQAYFDSSYIGRMTHQCYGAIKEKSAYTEVAILTHKFEDWLSEAGFSDSSVVLRSLKEKGILDYETGKNTRKRKLYNTTEPQLQPETQSPQQQKSTASQTVYVLKLEKNILSNYNQSAQV